MTIVVIIAIVMATTAFFIAISRPPAELKMKVCDTCEGEGCDYCGGRGTIPEDDFDWL